MTFYKSFPITKDKYPSWEEISLSDLEEEEIEKKSKEENIVLLKECIEDANKIVQEKNLKFFQSDIIQLALALFEKRASHIVYWKENKCREKFDHKFKK